MKIEIRDLKKIYKQRTVLDIEALTISPGDIIGLVGNNGAGKTTLIRLMLDLIKPDSGEVEINSEKVSNSQEWKKKTSAFIDEGFLVEFLTPEEYFEFIANNYNVSKAYMHETLEELTGFMNGEILGKGKYIREFSSGNKQKVGIIGALLTRSAILILDEPFNFIDPGSQYFLSHYLSELNRKHNTTILISSHNLELVYGVSKRILLLDNGCVIKDRPGKDENVKQEINNYFKV